jgi:uncharacterized protein
MLLDLKKLHGPREHVERTLQPSAFDPQDKDYRVAAPVELSLDVQKAGGDAFKVSGRFTTVVELDCSRCIEPFTIPVEAAFDLRYLPQSSNAGEGEREIQEEDLTAAYYREGTLDIGELLREQFQLALPMKPLCEEACKGLCPQCGTNMNTAPCDCAPGWEDPRLAPLKGLLNRDKEK